MAQHLQINIDPDTLAMQVAQTALRTAQENQTRKAANVYIPSGDGTGVLIGNIADTGISRYDPESETQSPLWEGVSQEELDAKAEEILGAAKEDTAAQITIVNTTITEAQQAIEANREGIEAEAYLREEGDKRAQETAAAVKAETDRLSTKYDEMDTSVTSVKNDLKNVMTSTTQLEQDMIVSTLIEYAVGDSDTVPPDLATYWMGEPNNSVSVLSDPWGPTTPERTPGTYIWMRTRVTFGDGGQETSAPVLVTGNTGAQGPQGVPGEPGEDGLPGAAGANGKTSYMHLAYANSADGRTDFSTSDSNRDYIGQYTDFTQQDSTDPSKYTWSKIKGATGAQGVSVSALTPFWQLAESKPAQPVNKSPGGGWTSTEPAYVRGKKLWTCSRIDYSNGQWSWTSVQQSSAFEAAELALTTANGKNRRYVQPSTPVVDASELTQGDEWWQTSSKPPETYWTGTPNNSVSVLVDHSGEVEHIWVWNGKRWALNRLSAEDIIVSGSVAAGLVTADFFDGARIRGGEFVTSNELIRLNNAGLIMDGKSGERLVTLNATDGTATFQNVAIINGSLSVPTIEGGSIEGADYELTAGTGENKQIVAQINSSGIMFGDHLAYAKNSKGKWTLSLKGAVQAGGTVSGAHVKGGIITTNTSYDPDDPAWEFDYVETDAAKAAVKYRGVWITSGGLFAYKNNGKKEYAFAVQDDGSVVFDGPVISNASLTSPTLQTDPASDRGIKVVGNTLTAFSRTGTPMLSLNGDTGSAMLVGGFKTATNGRRLEITNSVYGTVSVGAIHGYDLVGESWHIVGSSDRTSTSDIDNWYTTSLGIGINPQQPELNIRYENRYKTTVMSLLANRIDIIGAGTGRNPYGDGVYVNNRRIDWEQSWTDIALANGSTAVGTAQFGQRSGLLVFRGRIKCANTGDCDLFDLASVYSGFETSNVNRTWIIVTMTKGVATTARAFIPARSTMLRVNNGPHDWVDISSIVIGL